MEREKIEELDLGHMKPDDIEKLYEELNVFGITFEDNVLEEQSSECNVLTAIDHDNTQCINSKDHCIDIKIDDSFEQDLSLMRTHSMEQVANVRPKKIKTD